MTTRELVESVVLDLDLKPEAEAANLLPVEDEDWFDWLLPILRRCARKGKASGVRREETEDESAGEEGAAQAGWTTWCAGCGRGKDRIGEW
jgi:hypothetical protein